MLISTFYSTFEEVVTRWDTKKKKQLVTFVCFSCCDKSKCEKVTIHARSLDEKDISDPSVNFSVLYIAALNFNYLKLSTNPDMN